MIEITIRVVDGVRFYGNIRVLAPDIKRYGVGIHLLNESIVQDAELMRYLKIVGLKKVGYDFSLRSGEYTETTRSFLWYKAFNRFFVVYWWCIRWLYDNARVFKQIHEGTMFSWKYFTPYVWYKGLWK